jgi:L-fucono-1,5-lactonase
MIVDAHHHFWDPLLADYPWMTDDVAAIRRRFGPENLEPLLREHGVDGTVLVQARASLDETRWLLETAEATPFVLGVVGWIDLTDPEAARVLAELRGRRLVGIRHQVHDEPDPAWLLRPDVQRGIAAVGAADLAYDLLVRPVELPSAYETAKRHPAVRFVVDHLAKPPLRGGETAYWAKGLESLAGSPNVTCKLSGLVTEADPSTWRTDGLVEYHRRAIEWFGPERCMFGSDWPVCLLAAEYADVLELLMRALDDLDAAEQADVLGGTAARTYQLPTVAV